MEEAFDRNYLTNNGPLVQQLENEIAGRSQVEYCTAVCNGTLAQLLILKAFELEGEVILPSFTFISTAHACLWQKLSPVFCDISPIDLMIDPPRAEELITDRTSAVIGVHLFGNICDVTGLTDICRRHGLKLILDAAHAFGCRLGETPVGGLGQAEFFSFHATKFFSTFEGGAILTNDPHLDHRIKLLRNFGFRGYDDVGFLGINAKMSEASAAMGLASLPRLDQRMAQARETDALYRRHLSGIPGISLLETGRQGTTNYHYLVIMVDGDAFGVSRDTLNKVLWQENVKTRRYFYPGCHRMEPYRSLHDYPADHLPVTRKISKEILCLPTNLVRGEKDIEMITQIIKDVHRQAERINQWASETP